MPPRLAGANVRKLGRDRRIALQKAIPGRHQSLGSTGRRLRCLGDITGKIKEAGAMKR